jgi:taurine dioxygenase
LGVEVTGLDLGQTQDEATIDALRNAFCDHLMMVVRDQEDLSPDGQMRFCEFFGSLGVRARPLDDRPEAGDALADVMFVSNRKEDGRFTGSLPEGEMEFHVDQCYVERPARATCLYAIAVPDEGGDTVFANLCAAYAALPDDLRAIVDTKQARHVFSYGSTSVDQVDGAARQTEFVNRLMTREIIGLEPEASRDALDRLFALEGQPQFLYAHKWRKGDLVIWDNICTMHARTDFDGAQDRHLRRFTVAGGPLIAA